MAQEDKELLLRDLCARLPYGVKVYSKITDEILLLADISQSHMFPLNDIEILLNRKYPLQWCIPYLRPMSSMTEEEREEYHKLCDSYYDIHFNSVESIDWLNAHHFDFRNLIERRLAIDCTGLNVY